MKVHIMFKGGEVVHFEADNLTKSRHPITSELVKFGWTHMDDPTRTRLWMVPQLDQILAVTYEYEPGESGTVEEDPQATDATE